MAATEAAVFGVSLVGDSDAIDAAHAALAQTATSAQAAQGEVSRGAHALADVGAAASNLAQTLSSGGSLSEVRGAAERLVGVANANAGLIPGPALSQFTSQANQVLSTLGQIESSLNQLGADVDAIVQAESGSEALNQIGNLFDHVSGLTAIVGGFIGGPIGAAISAVAGFLGKVFHALADLFSKDGSVEQSPAQQETSSRHPEPEHTDDQDDQEPDDTDDREPDDREPDDTDDREPDNREPDDTDDREPDDSDDREPTTGRERTSSEATSPERTGSERAGTRTPGESEAGTENGFGESGESSGESGFGESGSSEGSAGSGGEGGSNGGVGEDGIDEDDPFFGMEVKKAAEDDPSHPS
jgi:uncharacterized membrane protein YgcG